METDTKKEFSPDDFLTSITFSNWSATNKEIITKLFRLLHKKELDFFVKLRKNGTITLSGVYKNSNDKKAKTYNLAIIYSNINYIRTVIDRKENIILKSPKYVDYNYVNKIISAYSSKHSEEKAQLTVYLPKDILSDISKTAKTENIKINDIISNIITFNFNPFLNRYHERRFTLYIKNFYIKSIRIDTIYYGIAFYYLLSSNPSFEACYNIDIKKKTIHPKDDKYLPKLSKDEQIIYKFINQLYSNRYFISFEDNLSKIVEIESRQLVFNALKILIGYIEFSNKSFLAVKDLIDKLTSK